MIGALDVPAQEGAQRRRIGRRLGEPLHAADDAGQVDVGAELLHPLNGERIREDAGDGASASGSVQSPEL